MKVLVIGSGGREHALAWQCMQSERVKEVFVAPGNAGTALEEGISNVDIAVEDLDGLASFAKENSIDLTIVGPEVPLVLGVVDHFQTQGLKSLVHLKVQHNWKVPRLLPKIFLLNIIFQLPPMAILLRLNRL